MSTYDFEPNPEDYGPEPAHIANSHRVKAKPKITIPLLPEPNVEYVSGHRGPLVFYDADQLREYGQQCREQALLDAMNATAPFGKTGAVIAAAIRSLK